MNIQSTRLTTPPKPESARIPREVSQPRSAISSTNRLFKAAEGFGLFPNPLPDPVQDTVSALGAGFASFNIGAEIHDRDWFGALEDTADGAVSLLGGASLLDAPELVLDGMSWAGVVLNGGFAVRDLKNKKYFDAMTKTATASGLGMIAVGGVMGPVGLTVLGTTGLCELLVGVCQSSRGRQGSQQQPS